MNTLGSGENGEFTFLDYLAIFSLWLGMQNLEMNLTQNDKQDLQEDLSKKTDLLLKEVHSHLKSQDSKLDEILKILEVLK